MIAKNQAYCLGRNNGQENVLFEIKGVEAVRIAKKSLSPTLKTRMRTGGNNVPCITLTGNTIGRQPHNGGNGNGFGDTDVHAVAYDNQCVSWNGDTTPKSSNNIALTMRANQGSEGYGVAYDHTIRKLTPKECERLQGFPDDYTKIPYRNKPAEQCPDSPRYKAIGNSMAVPVMQWIGVRLSDYLQQA
ncbi:DNA cytosine methyltransferase [Avibacterium paragallinarum]|uniref:Cytosine-specific methyltransferase n=1 Tax=Avibacterium paragallinarum TaxID=728 RepID=A0A377IUW3_AVIPA|nr:cytosine-specific methyltransferase [Avibacterium paragallinarum]